MWLPTHSWQVHGRTVPLYSRKDLFMPWSFGDAGVTLISILVPELCSLLQQDGISASLLWHSLYIRKSLRGPHDLQQRYLWLPVVWQRVLPGVWGVLPVVQGWGLWVVQWGLPVVCEGRLPDVWFHILPCFYFWPVTGWRERHFGILVLWGD